MFKSISEVNYNAIIDNMIENKKAEDKFGVKIATIVLDLSDDSFTVLNSFAENEGYSLLKIEQDNKKHAVACYLTKEETHRWVFFNGAV